MSEIEATAVCPWCHTEIIWDSEIGPEKHCPYCGNELSGYRTVQIGIDQADEEEDDDVEESPAKGENGESYDDLWDDEDSNTASSRSAQRSGGSFGVGGGHLAAQATVQRLLEQQLDMPECPVCREFLLEAGTQTVAEGFAPVYSKLLKGPLLAAPFQVVTYVCPACFHVANKLAKADQDRMIETLAEAADDL
ncbi:hypothetical protein [Paenibacillus methanolicus]|uniref:Uncharacterized protein n=1 Tax=Paenibacillus methanolicus TaxID=582686 RepID=A0A5S5BRR9_9BACL|nr:hypothetical protein [Paenibacillus methanolicus]TYP69769.1 hypothetical protein BCM02_113101 [Paenibacillus methanolicus]